MEEREPKLIVSVGRKGVGKTYTTNKMLVKYISGNPNVGIVGRKVLVVDVNDEYEDIKALKISDVMKFSVHPTIEARRIRPFNDNGVSMTTRELQETLFKILKDFRGGLLLIEDPSKFLSDSLPNDLMGAIATNRHKDLDLIMHFQSIGRITPKIWQNLTHIRYHKNTDGVEKNKNKFEDKYELMKLVENYVDKEYENGDKRVYVYVDVEDEKIKNIDKVKFDKIVEEYIIANQSKLITPMLNSKNIFKGVKTYTPEQALQYQKNRIITYYT
jgi:hypothetical protein